MTPPGPRLVVLRGDPDDAEVAAVAVALLALAAESAARRDPGRVNWSIPTWFTPPGSWTAR